MIFQLPSITFLMYLMLIGLGVLIPITGRSGPENNPELLIGILSTFFALILGGFIVSFFIPVKYALTMKVINVNFNFNFAGTFNQPFKEIYVNNILRARFSSSILHNCSNPIRFSI